ncbi:hypothetical protein, partial [Clostridium sp.]|uniref:hypothetical protein n=1 Tax=Clostridium sp. TaxID=1506 RepID=UPI002FDE5C63
LLGLPKIQAMMSSWLNSYHKFYIGRISQIEINSSKNKYWILDSKFKSSPDNNFRNNFLCTSNRYTVESTTKRKVWSIQFNSQIFYGMVQSWSIRKHVEIRT